MFDTDVFPVAPSVKAAPARLLFSILLAFPDYVTADPGASKFNLGAVTGRLIGLAG
jgi:hypothetical protein